MGNAQLILVASNVKVFISKILKITVFHAVLIVLFVHQTVFVHNVKADITLIL